MEDDSDTEMADYGTDFSDDVDRNFDANLKARPLAQQGSTVEIRSRRSLPLALAVRPTAVCRPRFLGAAGLRRRLGGLPACHSTGQLAMSDKQTTMSNDTLEKIVCLRNSRTAVTVLKKTEDLRRQGEARRA